MAQLNQTTSLPFGQTTKITNSGQLNNTTGTLLFGVPGRPNGGHVNALFQASVAASAPVTASGQPALSGK
jgi:hypothetical protein